MDEASGFCLGCARTFDEIAGWKEASEEARRLIWSQLPARRASLGIETHRLGWSVVEIRAFVLETLKPNGGTWVAGIYGAVAEFCIDETDAVAIESGETALTAITARGAIAFNLSEKVRVFSASSARSKAAQDVTAFALPIEQVTPVRAHGLTYAAQDKDAIKSEDRGDFLYDFGLGSNAVSFCIRTADSDLITHLSGWTDETHASFMPAIGNEILKASPTRVLRNAIGRIEVFAPIPSAGEQSPPGPHTHFLPAHLAVGGDLSPNLKISDSYVVCFIHYPDPPRNA